MEIKKKYNILLIIIFILIIIILVLGFMIYNNYNISMEENNEKETTTEDSADNSEYIGIYSYSDDVSECSNATTLVLTKDYSAIFYIGNCEIKSYYIGKYYIKDNIIYLYDLILEDSSNDQEEEVDSTDIHFNIVSSSEITSIFGRSNSITLNKLYNIV